jgi:hypothetical protein
MMRMEWASPGANRRAGAGFGPGCLPAWTRAPWPLGLFSLMPSPAMPIISPPGVMASPADLPERVNHDRVQATSTFVFGSTAKVHSAAVLRTGELFVTQAGSVAVMPQ